MDKCTAIVFSGGGPRGAFQVGAMRAILENGITPDLMVGSSIGAMNAAGLALWGVNLDGVDHLEHVWKDVSDAQMLNPKVAQLALRIMVGHPSDATRKKIENYLVSLGITRDLSFRKLPWGKLALISADLGTGQPIIFGENPDDSVLEGLMTSIALPPWFVPLQKGGQMLMDGGTLTNLPIEPTLLLGATEIIALDLDDPSPIPNENPTLTQYFKQYLYAVGRRHVYLETALAEAQGVPVRTIDFRGISSTQTWDFRESEMMIRAGYERANRMIDQWTSLAKPNYSLNKAVSVQKPVWYGALKDILSRPLGSTNKGRNRFEENEEI